MSFRTRVLVCGYEPEQTAGRDEYEYGAERWWVHTAAYSAQGAYSLPWWPVPRDTVKGDLFVVRLAAFEVPEVIRSELASGRIELGVGVTGKLAEEAIEYSNFPLFGGGYGDRFVEVPNHPEFDPSRKTLGNGIAGLAVAHSAATLMPEFRDGEIYEALLGTFVPFPDVIAADQLLGRFGKALDDLTTPMMQRDQDRINLGPVDFDSLIRFVLDRFPGDDWLRDSVFRLKEVAARMSQPMSYFPIGLSPVPSWLSGGKSVESAAEFFSRTSREAPEETDIKEGSEGRGEESLVIDPGSKQVENAFKGIMDECVTEYHGWVAQERAADDRPLALERIVADDGTARLYFELPSTEADEPSITRRLLNTVVVLGTFSPNPSAAILVHDQTVYFVTAWFPDGTFEFDIHATAIPAPGEGPGSLDEFDLTDLTDLTEGMLTQRAEGPYGEEAVNVSRELIQAYFTRLDVWAKSERSERDLPLEEVMYDGGEVWRHKDVPPTELSRPGLVERVQELIPLLVEVAPAPAVVSFVHRKKLLVLAGMSKVPGDVSARLFRFAIPPPGEPFAPFEDVDISKLGLDG